MADVTGGTPPTGSSPFRPPEDFQAAYDHFGGPEMFSVRDAAALPSSGNWPGRTLVARDKGIIYVNPAGDATWVVGAVRPIGSSPVTFEQQGRSTVTTDADGYFTVTFPTAFPTACDRVIPVSASPGTYYGGFAIDSRSTTSFRARVALASATFLVDWRAVGR